MTRYRLSERADQDFESIYLYGLVNFGFRQADAYADGLEARFEQIALQPSLYPAIDHIRRGYRYSVYKRHSIYYQICAESPLLPVRGCRAQPAQPV